MRAEHLHAMRLTAGEVDRFLNDFVAYAEHINQHFRVRPLVRDPNDDMFAELAINGRADALISFNIEDYRPADPQGDGLRSPSIVPAIFSGG